MPFEAASALTRLGVASVAPTPSGEWRVAGVTKVGVVRVGEFEVNIEPKVPLDRLFYLLARGRQWGSWFDESVKLGTVNALYPAISEAFATWAERVLRAGVARGYRSVRAAEPAIRGRWLVSEQMRIRHGLPLPAELQYDEFTIDIVENQIVRSAVRRLLAFSSLSTAVRTRLMRVDLQLQGVSRLSRGEQVPRVLYDRRNERYRPLVALSELVLTNGSLDHRVGSATATGFLLDLPKIFEDFVKAEIVRSFRAHGGEIRSQAGAWLDRDAHVRIRPDLIWHSEGAVRAVFDAKYKSEKPAGFPNADVYQMLAYCIRHRLPSGHLIYASGNEVPARYTIAEAGIEIYCHSLALDKSPPEISQQIDEIVAVSIREGASSLNRT
jgi:5-methylcytosine-specific restriction enzyme subunit McrC